MNEETCIDWTSFDIRHNDFGQSATQKIICCVTDQSFITRSRRSVVNIKFSVLSFLRSMGCSMSIEQNCANRKSFNSNLCQCNNMYESTVCCQELWHTLSGLDIQVEQFENDNPGHDKMFRDCEKPRKWRFIYRNFNKSIQTYGFVVKVGCSASGDIGSIHAGSRNSQPSLGHFA